MDRAKFDDLVLAMLWFNQQATGSAWKTFGWESTDRLFQAGLISNPKAKRKSVVLTEHGEKQAEAAFERHFGKLR